MRAAGVETAGQCERCVIRDLNGRRQIFRGDHCENRPKDFFLRQTRGRLDGIKDGRRDVISLQSGRQLSLKGKMMFAFTEFDVSLNLLE